MKFFTKHSTFLKNVLRSFSRALSAPQDELRIPLYWTLLLVAFFLLLTASFIYNALLALSSLKEEAGGESELQVGIVNRGEVHDLVRMIELRAHEFESRRTDTLEINDPAE